MMRVALLALGATLAAGFAPTAAPHLVSKSVSTSRPAVAPVAMADEPSDQAATIGAAWVGGLLGVQATGDFTNSLVLALVFAYGSTTASKFGDFAKACGSTGAKIWGKTAELNDEYGILPKAKSALDVTFTVAGNLDKNYGITEQLKLGQAYDKIEQSVVEARAPPLARAPAPAPAPRRRAPSPRPSDAVVTWCCPQVKDKVTAKVDDLKAKASSS
jgi:hypothetical protein